MGLSREEIRERKVKAVIDWLERPDDDGDTAIVKRHKGNVIVVPIGGLISVYTESRVAKWFDEAAIRMRAEGIGWEDALAETWPADEAEADDEQAEEKAAA